MRALEAFGRLLTFLTGRVRYTAAPVQTVLRLAADSGEFPEFPFLKEAALCPAEEFSETWDRLVQEYRQSGGLLESDVRLWQEWGKIPGRVDMSTQMDTFRLYGERLQTQLREARQTAAEKGRLYLSLGLTGGLAAALLLV